MDLLMERDAAGRLTCTLVDQVETATVIAREFASAADDLEAALADACRAGYGECVWQLTDGDYKWLFRRTTERIDIVVLWSAGVVTGWQHVFRTETGLEEFTRRVSDELARLRGGTR